MPRPKAVRTTIQARALKPEKARYIVKDADLRGHYVRVTPNDVRTFVAVARDPYGKQVWATVGDADVLEIDEARTAARNAVKRIKAGQDPFEAPPPKPDSFKAIAEQYIERHVKANGIRTQAEIERCLTKYVYPNPKADPWERREFKTIKRSDVAKLLDFIEDNHGARQADVCLTIIAAVCNWYAARDDDYVSPIVRGMRRDARTKRERILDDAELAVIWKVAEGNGKFGAILRLDLLTAQRLGKVAAMRWDEITVDGIWSVPSDDREKGNIGKVKLPAVALAIIRDQGREGDNPYVFAGRPITKKGNDDAPKFRHFNGFSASKRLFDDKVLKALKADDPKAKPLENWTIHDLRRTSRSLLSRAGVRPDVSERVLGHVIAGVEGVYDRHRYDEEKAAALNALADMIDRIVTPRPSNVATLRAAQ